MSVSASQPAKKVAARTTAAKSKQGTLTFAPSGSSGRARGTRAAATNARAKTKKAVRGFCFSDVNGAD